MTSLGRLPRKPKESSRRGNYPTAGDIAAEIEAEPEALHAESLTTHVDDAYEIDVDGPSYDDPVVPPVAARAALVSTPVKEREAKPAKAPKPAKVRRPKPVKEPKPAKVKAEKPPKTPKPAKAPKPPKTPRPPRLRNGEPSRAVTTVAAFVGVLGLLASVVLAVGALFIALDAAQGSSFFSGLSTVCDALVGPLKDVFTFSGTNADKKQALVGWGLGSMGYLLVGRFLQSLLQSRINA